MNTIGHFRLLFGTSYYLDLIDTLIVLSFRQNLASVFLLDKFGYHCSLGNNKLTLSLNSNIVGNGSLNVYDNFY